MALHCEEDCGSWRVYSDDGDFDANCDDEAMARTVTATFDLLAACVFFEEWDNYGLDKGMIC